MVCICKNLRHLRFQVIDNEILCAHSFGIPKDRLYTAPRNFRFSESGSSDLRRYCAEFSRKSLLSGLKILLSAVLAVLEVFTGLSDYVMAGDIRGRVLGSFR